MEQIAAQSQQLVTVAGIDGFFAAKSGGEVTSEISKVYDGGSLRPENLSGRASPGDVTISRPYRPARDGALLKKLYPLAGRWRTSVTVQDTDADLVPVGAPTVYPNALLMTVTAPEHDAGSGEPARIELVFSVVDVV